MFAGMRILAALIGSVLAVGVVSADTPAAPGPAPAKVPAKAAPAVTPAKNAKKDAKKEEPMGKISGTEIARANGTFLGLEVVNGNFKLTFYDKKKKPMNMDVTRATARWPNPRAPGDNRTVLKGSGTSLIGSKPVVPPFTFNVYLTLLQGEGEEAKAVESYVVPFRG